MWTKMIKGKTFMRCVKHNIYRTKQGSVLVIDANLLSYIKKKYKDIFILNS